MNSVDALELVQAAIICVLWLSAPIVIAATVVGVAIAFLQAITQIQEVTLTFVPKIVVILLVVLLMSPYIGQRLSNFTKLVYSRIEEVR